MTADEEEEAKENRTIEASDAEITPENENRIFCTCNSDGCPICFGVFGKLLLSSVMFMNLYQLLLDKEYPLRLTNLALVIWCCHSIKRMMIL
jgi:hypothetical protein